MWDGILKHACWSLGFVPAFFAQLKAIIYFLRDRSLMQVLVADFRSRGLDALADVVSNSRFPTFAQWRWSKLETVCKELSGFLASFAAHFTTGPFSRVSEERSAKVECGPHPTTRPTNQFSCSELVSCVWLAVV